MRPFPRLLLAALLLALAGCTLWLAPARLEPLRVGSDASPDAEPEAASGFAVVVAAEVAEGARTAVAASDGWSDVSYDRRVWGDFLATEVRRGMEARGVSTVPGAEPVIAVRLDEIAGRVNEVGRLDEARVVLTVTGPFDERYEGVAESPVGIDRAAAYAADRAIRALLADERLFTAAASGRPPWVPPPGGEAEPPPAAPAAPAPIPPDAAEPDGGDLPIR